MFSKFFTYLSIFLAATLLLVFVHVRGWARPVESVAAETARPFVYVFTGTGNYIKSFFGFFSSVSSLNQLNSDLRDQVRGLQEENAALEQFKLENDILKKELGYRNAAKFDLVSADIIAKDPTGFSQTVTLDIGGNQNIRIGDAVLSQGALVGKITSVESFTAKALLITDPQSSIDAQLAASGQNGVLRGSFGSGVVLDEITQNVPVNKDDKVVTAGLTDQVPRGILIGTIGQLQSSQNALLQKATVIPAVDLKMLQFVAVLRR